MVGELAGSMKLTNLESLRLKLERVSMDYLEDYHGYSVTNKFFEFLEYKPFNSKEESKRYLQKLINRTESKSNHYWFIKLKSNQVIGTIGLLDIDYRKGMAEIIKGIPNLCTYNPVSILTPLMHALILKDMDELTEEDVVLLEKTVVHQLKTIKTPILFLSNELMSCDMYQFNYQSHNDLLKRIFPDAEILLFIRYQADCPYIT